MKPNHKIKRNYNKRFFSNRKRGLSGLPLFFAGLLVGLTSMAIVLMVSQNYNQVQYMALDALGIAPTPTLYASQHAQKGIELYTSGDVNTALVEFKLAVY